jgi:anti-sigma-K factor RskA
MTDAFDSVRIGCEDAFELIDAYALGALEKPDAEALERHVADCLSCWEELNKSQRTAALLSLSVPIKQAPPRLRARILTEAQREDSHVPVWRKLLPNSRRAAVPVLAFAGVAALFFTAFVQAQLSDLRGDKNHLTEQLSVASSELDQQRQILAVLSAADAQKVAMQPAALRSSAESVYNWSRDNAAGFIVCRNFPVQAPGRVYEVWFVTGRNVEPVATFVPEDGRCQIPMDMSRMDSRPDGIGISIEPEGGSSSPSSPWFVYATFDDASTGGRAHDIGIGIMAAAIGP